MIPIYPLTEESIRKHCGQRLIAVTHDGRQYTGILSRVKNGQLIFNENAAAVSKKRGLKTKKKKASTSRVPVNPKSVAPTAPVPGTAPIFPRPAGPIPAHDHGYAEHFVLDLSTIALLFVVLI